MGKKQHQGDKLYLTTREWKHLYGGHKDTPESKASQAKFKRLPFDHCCLTLQPYENPVCDEQGNIFELMAIVPYLKRSHRSPVTGKKLDPKSLINLNIQKNKDGEYHCPVTFKLFTNNTHIVAMKPTGNVYSYEAVEQLNIKAKYWKDLLNDVPITRADMITIQDPDHIEKFNIAAFYLVKQGIKAKISEQSGPVETLRVANAETKATLEQLAKDYVPPEVQENGDGPSTSGLDSINAAHFSTGTVAYGLTSTVMEPETKHVAAVVNEDILRYERVTTKGYVRMVTNVGNLNFELHCDQTPKACENFMKLCERGYYDGTRFHRSIKHFMIQGGDPTGTGNGGESMWEKPFSDEFRPNLRHSGRGVLSMANSGKNTNKSQFFITYRSCNHLDNKHTVFGRLVGGLETLSAMEKVETDDKDRPKSTIAIQSTHVFVDPFAEADEKVSGNR